MYTRFTNSRFNTREDRELEGYFGRIQATFGRKAMVTFFDMAYVLITSLPVFVMIAYFRPGSDTTGNGTWGDIVDAFHKLVEHKVNDPSTKTYGLLSAWRMLGFSVWMIFAFYIYFVFIPSKTTYQTFFSSYMGMRAVTLDDNRNWKGKISQKQLFRANFIPVFLIPIVCALFFLIAGFTHNLDWHEAVLKKLSHRASTVTSWSNDLPIYGMRVLFVIAFGLQFFYMFTVGASKNALNWMTRSNGIIYVNMDRANVVMSTEDLPIPNKNNPFDMTLPGTQKITPAEIKKHDEELAKEAKLKDSKYVTWDETIDFTEHPEMSTEDFFKYLEKKKEEENQK